MDNGIVNEINLRISDLVKIFSAILAFLSFTFSVIIAWLNSRLNKMEANSVLYEERTSNILEAIENLKVEIKELKKELHEFIISEIKKK